MSTAPRRPLGTTIDENTLQSKPNSLPGNTKAARVNEDEFELERRRRQEADQRAEGALSEAGKSVEEICMAYHH